MTTPLRIAYVISYFHPLESGAERQALVQGAELARRGHSVRVLTRHVGHLPDEEVVRGVHVSRCLRVHDQSRLFIPSFLSQVARTLGRLRREIDLVQTHQGLWEAAGAGLARAWLGRIPTVVQPASSGPYGEAEELLRQKGRAILRRLILANSHFIAISRDIEAQWRRLGVAPNRMTRIASGVETTRFHPGTIDPELEATLPPRPRFLFTGRFHPQKNLPMLIEAWSSVVRQTPAHLLLLGWGPDRPALEVMIEERGLGPWVHLLELVPDPAPYLRAADAFVLPSVAEGMSNSLLEAMASGLPCLASAIGGNDDLVADGRTGRLLPPHEPSAWASAIVELARDPDLARQMGEEGLTRVRREFAIERVMDRFEALYQTLIAEARR